MLLNVVFAVKNPPAVDKTNSTTSRRFNALVALHFRALTSLPSLQTLDYPLL
jgi:hypothetical protein